MKSFEAMSRGEATVNGESAHETEGGSMPAIYLFTFNRTFVWGNRDLCYYVIFLSSVFKYNIWYTGKMISCMQPGGLFDLSFTSIFFRFFEALS